MWVEDAGVDDEGVDQPQGPEVVLQPVADEYCRRRDETHQVVLNVTEALGRTRLSKHCNLATNPTIGKLPTSSIWG